jgi:polyisoprenoid-binding protein YceI
MTESAPSAELAPLVGSWTLDPARTSVRFTTKAMWVLPVNATVDPLEGSAEVSADGSVTGTLVLDAASVNTKMAKRDEHLRTADFFDVATYPHFVITVSSAKPTGRDTYLLDATIALHGQVRPATLSAKVAVAGNEATVTIETDIDRSQWGVTWTKMGAGLRNHVVAEARFTTN